MEGYIFLFLYGPYISNYYSIIYFFTWFNYLDNSCSFGYLLSKSTQFCSLNWLIKLQVSYVIKVFYIHVNRQVRSGLPPLPPPPTHTHTPDHKFCTLIYLKWNFVLNFRKGVTCMAAPVFFAMFIEFVKYWSLLSLYVLSEWNSLAKWW